MPKYDLSKADAHMGASIVLGLATLLLLFTCISSPVVESMRIFRLRYRFDTAVRWVDVGLWGYCIEELQGTFRNPLPADPGVFEGCSPSRVGFTLDKAVADALHLQSLDGLYSRVHTGFLVVYPIVTVMSFLSCIFQVGIHLSRRTRSMVIQLTPGNVKAIFIFNSIATFFVVFAFVIQLSVGVKAKVQLKVSNIKDWDFRHGFVWGNTLWLSVISLICHLIDLAILRGMKHEAIDREREQEAIRAAKKSKNKNKNKNKHKNKDRKRDGNHSLANEIEDIPGAPVDLDEEKGLSTPPPRRLPGEQPPAYDLDGYTANKERATT